MSSHFNQMQHQILYLNKSYFLLSLHVNITPYYIINDIIVITVANGVPVFLLQALY